MRSVFRTTMYIYCWCQCVDVVFVTGCAIRRVTLSERLHKSIRGAQTLPRRIWSGSIWLRKLNGDYVVKSFIWGKIFMNFIQRYEPNCRHDLYRNVIGKLKDTHVAPSTPSPPFPVSPLSSPPLPFPPLRFPFSPLPLHLFPSLRSRSPLFQLGVWGAL